MGRLAGWQAGRLAPMRLALHVPRRIGCEASWDGRWSWSTCPPFFGIPERATAGAASLYNGCTAPWGCGSLRPKWTERRPSRQGPREGGPPRG